MVVPKKNIGIILRDLSFVGGVERIASNLSLALAVNYNVFIIIYDDRNINFEYAGTLLPLYDNTLGKSFLDSIIRKFSKTFKIRQLIKQNNIDTTISFGENPNLMNVFSRYKNQVVLTIHSYKSNEEKERGGVKGFLYRMFIKMFYNKADNIITVSDLIKKDLVDNFKLLDNKIKTIYNPFDIQKIVSLAAKPLDTEYQKKNDEKIVVSVGRICNSKAFWHLIRAFRTVKEQYQTVRLQIIGGSRLEDDIIYLNKVIRDTGMEDSVQLVGNQVNPYNFIKQADVFASSSVLEGLPSVIIESFACGTPVIFPDCKSGPRELLAPGTDIKLSTDTLEYAEYGVLTPIFDGNIKLADEPLTRAETLLAEAIIVLLNDNDLTDKYVEKGLKRAFDFDTTIIIKHYEEILS